MFGPGDKDEFAGYARLEQGGMEATALFRGDNRVFGPVHNEKRGIVRVDIGERTGCSRFAGIL